MGASIAFAVQGLCFAGVLSHVPQLQDKFALSDLTLTMILLAVPVIAGVGSVLAGVIAGRSGSAVVLRLAGVGVCLAVAGIGFAPSRVALYAAVGAFGLVVGMVDATMNMQGVGVQRRYGRSLLASCHAWWSVAGIAGALITSGTAYLNWSLAASMGSIGALGLVLALIAGPALLSHAEEGEGHAEDREGHAEVTQAVESAAKPKIAWGRVTLIGLAVMIMFVGESSTSNWSTVFLDNTLHASGTVAPLGLAAYLTFQLLGRAGADRVIGRFGSMTTVIAGALLGVAGFAVVTVAQVPLAAIGGFALVGVGLCVVVPLSFSAADALDPTGSGVVIARVNLFNYAGFVVGAALIGVIAEVTTLRWAFAVPAILVCVLFVLSPVFRVADMGRTPARSSAAR
jgi:predicted MFS family arabinose efflux permease